MAIEEELEKIRSISARCLSIYLGEASIDECSLCPYKEYGVDCVLELIKAQDKVIKKYTEGENKK